MSSACPQGKLSQHAKHTTGELPGSCCANSTHGGRQNAAEAGGLQTRRHARKEAMLSNKAPHKETMQQASKQGSTPKKPREWPSNTALHIEAVHKALGLQKLPWDPCRDNVAATCDIPVSHAPCFCSVYFVHLYTCILNIFPISSSALGQVSVCGQCYFFLVRTPVCMLLPLNALPVFPPGCQCPSPTECHAGTIMRQSNEKHPKSHAFNI